MEHSQHGGVADFMGQELSTDTGDFETGDFSASLDILLFEEIRRSLFFHYQII